MIWNSQLRLIVAAIVAPLCIFILLPPEFLLWDMLSSKVALEHEIQAKHSLAAILLGYFWSAQIYLPFCYILMLLVGVPAFQLLRKHNLASIWAAAAVGLVCPFIASFVMGALITLSVRSDTAPVPTGFIRHYPTIWQHLVFLLRLSFVGLPFAPVGVATAMVFWAIARPDRYLDAARASEA